MNMHKTYACGVLSLFPHVEQFLPDKREKGNSLWLGLHAIIARAQVLLLVGN